ncbi:MAG: T9SS type A sorting domain-containing protein [Bacteroidia bacterium]
MKTFSRSILVLLFFFFHQSYAQRFIRRQPEKKLTFVEMQRQFDEFARTHDLKKTRHWKYYKRWENDMQYKTDGHGELADPAIYIGEAVKAASQKSAVPSSSAFSSAAWSPFGPYFLPGNLTGYMQNGIGRINCIAFHPTDPNTYFCGVAQGGLWKTTNDGASWTPLTDNLPIERISDIVIDPANTNTMYISVCDFEYIDVALNIDGRKRNTHYGLGVYKTTDGGLSWNPTGLSFLLTDGDASLIRKVLINPTNSNNLVACGVSGMYTSSNAGTTWTKVLDSLCWDLVQDPVNPNTIYATSGWLAGSGRGYAAIYKSTNFGASWTMLPTGIPGTGVVQRIKLAIAPSDNNYIYAMTVDDQEGGYGIYKSTNAGASWTYINPGANLLEGGDGSSPGGQGTYDLGFTVNRTNKNIVYVGGVNIWASTDGANTFDPVSHWTLYYGPTIHGDIHFIETNPLSGDVFVCSDGGLYKTSTITSQTWAAAGSGSPWPTNWTTVSDGMNITSFYRLSSSRNATGRLVAGAQDNATFYYDGTSWNTIFGGDGMDNYLDPVDDMVVIGASQYGNFYVSNDGGVTDVGATVNVNSEAGEWTSPIVADYNNYGTLYAGFTNVNKSTDGGFTWSALTPLPSNGINDNETCALAVANSNSNVVYAARRIRFEFNSPSGMYYSNDAGTSWTEVTAGLPDTLYFTSIDVDQLSASKAYVSLSGFEAGEKVYRTTDAGATWQNISYNLPNIPVNCIKTIPGYNKVMAATDLGVYMLDETSNTWISQSAGLPNVIVTDIEFNSVLNKAYISTFGRGIWETNLDALAGIKESRSSELGIDLFPTANNGTFTIQLKDSHFASEVLALEIIDVNGKKVFGQNLQGNRSYSVDTKLAPGMYFARISNRKISGVKSFIIQ